MKKSILFCFVAVILIAGCAPKKPKEVTVLGWGTPYQITPDRLNGKVKEVKELTFWATEKDGKIEKGKLLTQKERDSLHYDLDYTAYFNEDGLISKVEYITDNGEIFGNWDIAFENGKYKSATWTKGGKLSVEVKSKIDAKGKITGWETFKPGTDTLIGKTEIVYDQNYNFKEWKIFDKKGELSGRTTFKCNEKNQILEYDNYSKSDSLRSSTRMTYNEKGFFDKVEFVDGKGNVTLSITNKYECDDHGNWIKNPYYVNGKLQGIEERIIKYY